MSAQYAVLREETPVVAIVREESFPTPMLIGTGPRGEKGDPGGNTMAIGLFTDASGISIPVGTDAVRTSGHTVTGVGIADYYWDGAVDAAYVAANPRTSFITTNGRGFRLAFVEGPVSVSWFGAVGDGAADDTAPCNAAVAYVFNLGGGKVFFPRGTYLVGELTIPAHQYVGGTGSWPTVELCGEAQASATFGTISNITLTDVGSVIKSNAASGAVVMVSAYGGSFSGVHLVVRNLLIRTYDNPAIDGINAWNAAQLSIYNSNVDTGVYSVHAANPTNGGKGIVIPQSGNGAITRLENVSVSGYARGVTGGEHFHGSAVQITSCLWAFEFWGGPHSIKIDRASVQRCQSVLAISGSPVVIDAHINVEHANPALDNANGGIDSPGDTSVGNGWQVTTSDVLDPLNAARGRVVWNAVLGGVGPQNSFTKASGGGIYLRTERLQEIGNTKVASFRKGSNQSLPNGVVATMVYDTADRTIPDVSWSSGSGVITIVEGGMYRVTAMASFAANASGERRLHILRNGTIVGTEAVAANGAHPTILQVSQIAGGLVAGDQLFAWAYQDSGGALDLVAGFDSITLHLEKLAEPTP